MEKTKVKIAPENSFKIEQFPNISKINSHVEGDTTDYGRLWKNLNGQQAPNELNHGSLFNGTAFYKPWRMVRMMKLCKLMGGKEWFRGKRTLELGCGHGHVSRMLKDWGAEPLATDGSAWCVEATKYFWPDLEVRQLDQTTDYNLGKFDLVIHWGVSYHLPPDAWEYDLMRAVDHGGIVSYESQVVDSDDPGCVRSNTDDKGEDRSLTGTGTHISVGAIEGCLRTIGKPFKRYDDADLDTGQQKYSWEAKNEGFCHYQLRRFWMIGP